MTSWDSADTALPTWVWDVGRTRVLRVADIGSMSVIPQPLEPDPEGSLKAPVDADSVYDLLAHVDGDQVVLGSGEARDLRTAMLMLTLTPSASDASDTWLGYDLETEQVETTDAHGRSLFDRPRP